MATNQDRPGGGVITSWFTFGQIHVHSIDGKTFDRNCVVKITAPDPRSQMVTYFGVKWAMEYQECPDLAYYPRGVIEL
jgi:hypothetical protein